MIQVFFQNFLFIHFLFFLELKSLRIFNFLKFHLIINFEVIIVIILNFLFEVRLDPIKIILINFLFSFHINFLILMFKSRLDLYL